MTILGKKGKIGKPSLQVLTATKAVHEITAPGFVNAKTRWVAVVRTAEVSHESE